MIPIRPFIGLIDDALSSQRMFGSGLGFGTGSVDDIASGVSGFKPPSSIPGGFTLPKFPEGHPALNVTIPRPTRLPDINKIDDVAEPASVLRKKRGLGKKAGMGLLGGIGLAGLYSAFSGEGPEEEAFKIPEYSPQAYGPSAGTSIDVSGVGSSTNDGYTAAMKNMEDYYDQLINQSAQEARRREQVTNQLYQEQQEYNKQLMGYMGNQNKIQKAELDQFHNDMREDLEGLSAGGQGFSMAGTEGDRTRLFNEAMADASADQRYASSMGGSLDDLLRANIQADATRHGELMGEAMAVGANEQQELRNAALAGQYDLYNQMMLTNMRNQNDRVANAENLILQAQLEGSTQGSGYVEPQDRAKALGEILPMFGDGLVPIPPPIQRALSTFMTTGDSNAINWAISTFQSLPEDWQTMNWE